MPYEWLMEAFRDIEARGIAPHEVVQALSTARRLPQPMRHPQGLSVLAIKGRTSAGRVLAVFVRDLRQYDWLILGARELTGSEREEFEKWESE